MENGVIQNEVTGLLFNHLFINVMANLMIIVLYRYFLLYSRRQLTHHSILLTLHCSVTAYICMAFPITVAPGYIFDLRQVSFLLGSILGGPLHSLLLAVVISFIRILMGGKGTENSIVVLTIMYLLIQCARPYYWKCRDRWKVAITVGLSVISSILIHALVYRDKDVVLSMETCLWFAIVQGLTVAAVFTIKLRTRRYILWLEEAGASVKNKVVSQIAASMSHEVRNPLTVIRGFIQLMSDRKWDAGKLDQYKTMIMDEIDRAVGIINDYLKLAKSEEEQSQDLVTLKQEVRYVLSVMGPYALLQGVEMNMNLDGSSLVRVNSFKLRQSLINLVKNAIEAMPNGGRLNVSLYETPAKAIMIIQDTGVGMSEEQMERIGTPFYSSKESGTGLGMVLVNEMIRSARGQIHIRSQQGKGTSFTLEFPLAQCDPNHMERKESVFQSH